MGMNYACFTRSDHRGYIDYTFRFAPCVAKVIQPVPQA
jgi:hypothetical protein